MQDGLQPLIGVLLLPHLSRQKGIKLHVWVDETRPRNQGANLTSYELKEEGITKYYNCR